MERVSRSWLCFLLSVAVAAEARPADQSVEEENQCILCHANADIWEGDTLHLLVAPKDLADDVHWQKGISCQGCHGGNPNTTNLREAHAEEDGFRTIESVKDIPDFCGHCHANAEYMRGFQPDAKTDQVAQFWDSVHGRHLREDGGPTAANCLSCHPKHQMRVAADPQSSIHPRQLALTCGACHKDQLTALRKSVHHAAGEKNAAGAGTLMDCNQCHGPNVHGMPPARDASSPVYLDHQVEACGRCHEKYLASYNASVHGHGLRQSGLVVTAVCSDCHNAHDIYYAADRRSTLHTANVAHTCGKCHHFIEQRLAASVHGRDSGPATETQLAAAGDKKKRKPSCVDCHQGHDQAHPDSTGFRRQLPNRCGNCHADYAQRYGMSLHGELTQLGYEPAARCSDCHGSHDILPTANPQSALSAANRVETCRNCHPNASLNFAAFDPHADPRNAQTYPWLYHITWGTEVVVYFLFTLFAIHAFFWFLRSLVHALEYGRHRRLQPGQTAIMRFSIGQRRSYALLIFTFMGLALTGLPLKYSDSAWAHELARVLGGFESSSVWHRIFALLAIVTCGVHLVWGVRRIAARRRERRSWKQLLFGVDSAVPNRRDARDIGAMLKWFVGFGRKPKFERWTYWEKFEYWALYLAVFLIALSGLMLWLPNLFCLVLPGTSLNLAKVVHADTALWIASLLVLIHFFNTHLRPEKFPLDMSLVSGLVSEEHLRTARPEFLERLRQEGRLEELRTTVPSRGQLRWWTLAGLSVLGIALVLLAAVTLAFLGV